MLAHYWVLTWLSTWLLITYPNYLIIIQVGYQLDFLITYPNYLIIIQVGYQLDFLITYPNYLIIIQVGYQSWNPKKFMTENRKNRLFFLLMF